MKLGTSLFFFVFLCMFSAAYEIHVMAEKPESVVSNIENNIHLLGQEVNENKKKQYIGNIKLAIIQTKFVNQKVRLDVISKLNKDANKDLKVELLAEVINVFQNDPDGEVQENFKKYIQEIKPELWNIVRAGTESSAECYSAATALTILQEPESQRFLEQYTERLNAESARQQAAQVTPMVNTTNDQASQEQVKREHDKRTWLQKLFKIKYTVDMY